MKKGPLFPIKPALPEGVKESPPMLINEISHLCRAKMRAVNSQMSQESTRLIITRLARKDGVTQLDLVKLTHLKPPTVSVTLGRLEKLGYITQAPDQGDQRAVRVYLTEKGRELDRTTLERIREIDEILMKGITPDESLQLMALLNKIRHNILQDLGITGEE
ncbi:MAG TPA: MarR family transcriptional regulator [Clostridiales bacterium]|nr:MAG: Transcriptional regulator SlyA [Firmicutes bacterium ADurb.Bin262]HOU10746.1 MarR family transcriptional regulator [Clostridiales bacterium]HQH63147.1 MarR family transcriptional regulator [Clostridiales bacterium]HQK72156.1 MarR family transcriptional regulator [Clostridiales bacterium]